MKQTRKVSVIMGVYNSDILWLKRAVNSILNQTYQNLELIICNDASTNGISNYLFSIQDDRVLILSNDRNSGLAFSLNKCLQAVTGEYIARMDDDDISETTRIEKQVEFLNLHQEIDIVGTALWLIDGDNVWGEDYLKEHPQKEDLLFGVVHAHPTIMVRKEIYDAVNGYRVLKKTQRTEDYDLYMRMYAIGARGFNIQEKLLYYTQSRETLSKRKFKHRIDEVACRFEGFQKLGLYPKGYLYLLKPIVAGLIPNFIKQIVLERRLRKRISFYTRSGIISPSSNYRLLQYVDDLEKHGYTVLKRKMTSTNCYKMHANAGNKVEKFIWNSTYYLMIQIAMTFYLLCEYIIKPDCIVISRAISPKVILPFNKMLLKKVLSNSKRVVWDFDDDIFSTNEITKYEKQLLFDKSYRIVLTNKRLMELLPNNIHNKVLFAPTTDDEYVDEKIELLIEERSISFAKEIRLLWLATASSLPNLRIIENQLDEAAKELKEKLGKQLVLNVVCNKPFESKISNVIINNILWSKEMSREITKESHIGIMPLEDTLFNRSKGGFKLIQYMSAAMPTIASSVGYNNEIIDNEITGYLINDKENLEGWKKAILSLSLDSNRYNQFSKKAREKWETSFSYEQNLKVWVRIFEAADE